MLLELRFKRLYIAQDSASGLLFVKSAARFLYGRKAEFSGA